MTKSTLLKLELWLRFQINDVDNDEIHPSGICPACKRISTSKQQFLRRRHDDQDCYCLKCLWSKKNIAAYLKVLLKYGRMQFFFLEYLFSFQRYLRFCELSDDVTGGFKQHNTQSGRSLEILKRCSSKLAPGLYITKEAKWHLWCRCHENMYAAGPVLIKTKISRFYPKRGSSTHNNL